MVGGHVGQRCCCYRRRGVVYLYNTSGQLLQSFHNPNNFTTGDFGSSVAISGNEVLIGASAQGAGVAYLFNTSGKLLLTFRDPAWKIPG